MDGYLWEIEKYRKINSEAEEYFAESFGHSNKQKGQGNHQHDDLGHDGEPNRCPLVVLVEGESVVGGEEVAVEDEKWVVNYGFD